MFYVLRSLADACGSIDFPAESPVEDCVFLPMDPLLKYQPPMVDCEGF